MSNNSAMASQNFPKRGSDVQLLYDALGLSADDQTVYDNFSGEFQQRLKDAHNKEVTEKVTSAQSSAEGSSTNSPHRDLTARETAGIKQEKDVEEEEDEDEDPPTDGTPGPDSWAVRKPTDYGEWHFPGHANYKDHEIPLTGDYGFMLLHRRPRFVPKGRYNISSDGQRLDQLAMCTLHYIDNTELHVQRETYPRVHRIDFTIKNDVRRVDYWCKKFLEQHGVGKRLGEKTPYLEEERDWIRDLFERQPHLQMNQLAARFNEHWAGREVNGVKRPERTKAALMNDMYRSNLKTKAVDTDG